MPPYKTSRDLQRELLNDVVSVDSSSVRRRLIEARIFARKQIEKQLLTPAIKNCLQQKAFSLQVFRLRLVRRSGEEPIREQHLIQTVNPSTSETDV
ncbi:hypothetical protein TNCV_2167201 [Trichonephila clavipes]|nr:hypothetical protein TNCV_2167201 [Trichonephila clavipes]